MGAPPDPSGSRAGGSLGEAAPAWLGVPVLLAVAALAGALVPGLLLATQGWFVPTVAGPVMAVGAVGAAWAAWPAVRPTGPRPGRTAHATAAVALVGLAGLSLLNLGRTGQWVLTDRDPGVVITAAGWLANEGSLDAPATPGAFSSVDWADGATAQGWSRDGTRAQPQFMHGAPVALAAARWIGGDGAMLHLSAVFAFLAGLCLFVLATRFMPGWAAAGAALSLLALAPQMFVARAAFSEIPAQLLLLGAAALLLGAVETGTRRALVVAGVTAAAVVLVRIDGALALAGIGPWLAARALASRRDTPTARHPRAGREVGWIGLGVAVVAVVAVVDALGPASAYVRFHRSEIASQLTLMALVWLASLVGYRIVARRRTGEHTSSAHAARTNGARWLAMAGGAAGGAVLASVAALWWIRPVVETTREAVAIDHVAVLQAAENLAVDPTRRYFEDSVRWFSWYLGPIGLVLAAAALAVAVGTWVAGRNRDPRRLLLVALAGVPTVVFVWRARTTPDQLWVLRRFVPATLPLLVALAWAAVAGLGPLVARRRPRWQSASTALSLVAAVALLIPLLVTTWPVRDLTLQDHALDAVDATCDALGPDAAALALADEGASLILPATLRFACEVPVAGATRPVRADELGRLADAWAAEGRRLVVVGGTESSLNALLGDVTVRRFEAASPRQPLATIGRPPGGLNALTVSWVLADVPRPGSAGSPERPG